MMTSAEIRQQFLDFFKGKEHRIVPSAPIVIKNDPTLLFTNAGMNQFKDYFLGNKKPENPRLADTQKCLRVSGKHNDLEEVGVDTYHHTMFEMLGNWSFGDYFKKEAIAWSWELLTEVYKLDKDRLYVTIFEGDEKEGLPRDEEAFNEWRKITAEDRILLGNKKDNFWEMGDTGPCGPCTEIHYDCRSDEERKTADGATLVNNDHPQVIEIWNNVFIQFNRLKDGSLEPLPAKHVDTGMGFERLVRVIQNKHSNYDTDVFTGTIEAIEKIASPALQRRELYEDLPPDSKQAVAYRVIADHIRAICFTIADGQLPSNTGAGYVIRRILRRAVRYYYSYLDYKQPLLHQLVPVLAKQFENVFPELQAQVEFVGKVVKEEEEAFLRTLEKGLIKYEQSKKNSVKGAILKLLLKNNYQVEKNNSYDILLPAIKTAIDLILYKKGEIIAKNYNPSIKEVGLTINQLQFENKFDKSFYKTIINELNSLLNETFIEEDFDNLTINGRDSFELNDTHGFPIDLTILLAKEDGLLVDILEFEKELQQQKNRSRAATTIDTEDWITLNKNTNTTFVGYDSLEAKSTVVKYRKIKAKGKEAYQVVLAETPFYAESGGQVGDTGVLDFNGEKIEVIGTKKENNLIIQFTEKLPAHLSGDVLAKVDKSKRFHTASNHSATHLLHAALRKVLGTHVAQKGSLVNDEQLRFDFSHFAKVTDGEVTDIEKIVNQKIRENIAVVTKEMNIEEAKATGAMALFGEKYGDKVRVVIIDPDYSIELCGGTHAGSTGQLGFFKIKHETAVAAGVRRIEAVSGKAAEDYINAQLQQLHQVKAAFNNPKELMKVIENAIAESKELKKKLESLEAKQLTVLKNELAAKAETINGINFIGAVVEISNADNLKKLAHQLGTSFPPTGDGGAVVLAANIGGKASVAIMLSEDVVNTKSLEAPKIIKEHITPIIKGGGGGNKTLATAGGQDAGNLDKVIEVVKSLL